MEKYYQIFQCLFYVNQILNVLFVVLYKVSSKYKKQANL